MGKDYDKFIDDFLKQNDATFYHVTTLEKWNIIRTQGLKNGSNGIYVTRSAELPILLFVAFSQIPEINDTQGIVILKLPQAKCKFTRLEIKPDYQAPDAWTQPFQNVILRNEIPIEMIELMMILNYPRDQQGLLSAFLNPIYEAENNYNSHAIMYPIKQIYDDLNLERNKNIYGDLYEDFLGS